MSAPLPDHSLSGHCSGIYDNTLYVLNNDGQLQSLPLKENATWTEESSGQTVNAPACVKATGGEDALYVVGGGSDDESYLGLQKYTFGSATWETLSPVGLDLQNRVNHSVVYLRDSDSILVYAGSPEDAPSDLSSQTFLLSTQPPYGIRSFTSQAPPANRPVLAPWNSSHAVMAGGQTLSNQIWLFGPDEGWTRLSSDLAEPVNSASRAVVVNGDDGSKVLQVYNMHTSPNTAQGIVLLGDNGRPAYTGQTVGEQQTSASRKRDLTIADWPTYNDTNASTSTRSDCSIAQGPDGLVVMAGGNDDEPVIMYNQKENSWIDVDQFFNSKQQEVLRASSTSQSPTTTPTGAAQPTATQDNSADAGGGMSSHDRQMRTLGITLGTLCGIAALFILALLFLRWRKLKEKQRNGGYLKEKEHDGAGDRDGNRMSFADRGASFMKEAGISAQDLTAPRNNFERSNNGSHSSLAIITNKWSGNKGDPYGHAQKASFESTAQLVKDREGNTVPAENHEMVDIGTKTAVASSNLMVPGAVASGTSLDKETRIERKRSSGWSKYFATSTPEGPNGVSHIPSVYVKPNTLSIDAESQYSTDTRRPSETSRIPSSALVPPLDIDFTKTVDGQRLSHVATGSPAFVDSREDLARTGSAGIVSDGQRGQIVDPRSSQATSINSYDNRSTISSNVTSEYYHEIHTPWTPMSGDIADRGRATSSVYTNSVRAPSRGRSTGFFPGAGTAYKPPKVKLSHAAGPTSEWASPRAPALTNKPAEDRDSTVTVFPDGKPETALRPAVDLGDLAPPRAPGLSSKPAEARDSTVTVFPGADYLNSPPRKRDAQAAPGAHDETKPINTDMSWLNLGLNRNQ
ncbi:Putative kelch-type beta propeller [Septoria linicola]|uniref:Kelch-type beta propeller n=1 Tax=Septoria linicola TaxID=215465 RepID=A0A9Q9AFZ3_9PEZI|nr:putative kelch-type beta propeller [Septoria linicola]USW48380.1 Putative kelch-type beta propeller [Septoria linicola]